MSKEKIYKMHQILKTARYPVKTTVLMERLECSEITILRFRKELKGTYRAPLKFDHKTNGWFYSHDKFELPGLWFTPQQLIGLLVMQEALKGLQPDFLADYLASFKEQIQNLLSQSGASAESLNQRLKLVSAGKRKMDYKFFQIVALATIRRRRLKLYYHTRGTDQHNMRDVSPQRLTFYRENWYLDAYCHMRQSLRLFAIDAIEDAEILNDQDAHEIDNQTLDNYYYKTYGIFSNANTEWAVLKFNARQARWVKNEIWHHDQKETWLADGSYQLSIPFDDTKELIREILKYGSDVEVISPAKLRDDIIKELNDILALYQNS